MGVVLNEGDRRGCQRMAEEGQGKREHKRLEEGGIQTGGGQRD